MASEKERLATEHSYPEPSSPPPAYNDVGPSYPPAGMPAGQGPPGQYPPMNYPPPQQYPQQMYTQEPTGPYGYKPVPQHPPEHIQTGSAYYSPGPPGSQYPPGPPGSQYPPGPQQIHGHQNVVLVGQPCALGGVVQRPPNYLALAIFSCLCCFWPTGICAIVSACNANSAADAGDMSSASMNANKARMYSIISIVIGIIVIVVLTALRLMGSYY